MKLTELQAKLGERMEALCRSDMDNEAMTKEIERSKATAAIGAQMVRNASVMLAMKKSVGSLDKDFVEAFV